jgi:hypothetical protein
MTWLKIFDAASAWPTDPGACYDDGFRVVAGYRGSEAWKTLSIAHLETWREAGFGIAAMYESSANRALSGYAAGLADGKTARAAWRAAGLPDDCFIAYAVDVNVNSAQIQGVVADYFRGVNDGDSGASPWAYIENDGIKWLFEHNAIGGGFQPAAWGWGNPASPDAWDAHAYWKQEHNGVSLHGGNVDVGHITDTANFWRAPGQGVEDMALTTDDVKTNWHTSTIADEAGASNAVSAANALEKARNSAEAAEKGVAALAVAVAKLPTTSAPATCNCPTIADIKAAIKAEIESIKVTAA